MRRSLRLSAVALALTLSTTAVVPMAEAAPAAPTKAAVSAQPTKQKVVSPTSMRVKFSQYPTADWRTRDSQWTGFRLRHPRGGRFYPTVTRWANLALAVMGEHRIAAKYLPGILAQIQQESSGNPRAINLWDSNAAAGYPSKGLLQVIAPTYRAYAKSGFGSTSYQTVPYTNLWAALNYVINTYGRSKFKSWNSGRNQGY